MLNSEQRRKLELQIKMTAPMHSHDYQTSLITGQNNIKVGKATLQYSSEMQKEDSTRDKCTVHTLSCNICGHQEVISITPLKVKTTKIKFK